MMPNLLLLLSMALALLYGFHLMKKLDDYLNTAHFTEDDYENR